MAFLAPAKAAAWMGKWPSLFCLHRRAPCFICDRQENGWRERQTETILCVRQSCSKPAVKCKEQLHNLFCTAGQLSITGRQCNRMNTWVRTHHSHHAPIYWEPRSYWWSRPESPGCSQGLPEDWRPWCCRTAAAAGSTDKKKKKWKQWAPPWLCPQLSHTYTRVLYPPPYSSCVSVWTTAKCSGDDGARSFRADGWVRFCQICKQLSVTLERSGCSKRQVHVLQEMWCDDMTVNDPFPSFCLNVLRSIVCLFNSIHSFFISFYFFNCLFFYLAYLHIFLFLFILYFYVIFSSFLLSIFLFCIFFYLFFTYCIFLLHIFLLNKKLAIFLLMRKTRLNKLFYNGLPVCVMALSERLNLRGHWNLLWWEWELNLILFHQKEIKSNVSYWPIEKIKPANPLQIS